LQDDDLRRAADGRRSVIDDRRARRCPGRRVLGRVGRILNGAAGRGRRRARRRTAGGRRRVDRAQIRAGPVVAAAGGKKERCAEHEREPRSLNADPHLRVTPMRGSSAGRANQSVQRTWGASSSGRQANVSDRYRRERTRAGNPAVFRPPLSLKTGGFASPPRGGFALFSSRSSALVGLRAREIYRRGCPLQTCPERETGNGRSDACSNASSNEPTAKNECVKATV